MSFLDGVIDLFGRDSAIVLGLLIPFLGLLIPAVVLLAIGRSHRMAPHGATAAASAAPAREGEVVGDGLLATSPRAAVASTERPGLTRSDELAWRWQCLRESDVFEGLTDDELRLVVAIGEQRHIVAGGRLASAGSRGETLFVILSGEIRLISHGPREKVVRTARVGETVPLAAIIDPPVLVTTVQAGTDCEVFAIPRQPLLDLFETRPMMGFQVYRAAARAFEQRYRQTLDHR